MDTKERIDKGVTEKPSECRWFISGDWGFLVPGNGCALVRPRLEEEMMGISSGSGSF